MVHFKKKNQKKRKENSTVAIISTQNLRLQDRESHAKDKERTCKVKH